jgi:outer membrane protein OmpA-like peptidoglycan-associated protein
MAHGSEESEDYWPGYVDALTSMVQVLAFVMMLLAMAVFVLSQNVAKSAVEIIAKAANIDAPANAGVVELTAKILEIVKQAREAPPKSADPSDAEPQPEIQTAPERQTDPATPAPAAPPTNVRAPMEKIVNSALRQRAPDRAPDGLRMLVSFKNGSFVIDSAAQTEIAGFVGAHVAGAPVQVVIRGFASPTSGSLSEARRIAYYRAITVRKDLLAQNVPAAAIQLRIIDTPDADQGRTAEIIAEPTATP